MSASKIFIGIMAGAAVGIAAGILLAPDSGKKTRKKIKRKMATAKTELENLATEAKKASTDIVAQAKGALEDAVDHVSSS